MKLNVSPLLTHYNTVFFYNKNGLKGPSHGYSFHVKISIDTREYSHTIKENVPCLFDLISLEIFPFMKGNLGIKTVP